MISSRLRNNQLLFLDKLKSVFPQFKFTIETLNQNKLPFLNVCIKNNQLDTKLIAINTTLNYCSNHPYPMIRNVANNIFKATSITDKLFISEINRF